MRKVLSAFALFALVAAPAYAQPAAPQADGEPKVKMVKKIVCKRIEEDQEIGSRLGPASKVCREVMVPAKTESNKSASHEHNSNTL